MTADAEADWLWHMWRSKPEGDPLGEYWRGRWEARVRERASQARSQGDQNGISESSTGAGACEVCTDS